MLNISVYQANRETTVEPFSDLSVENTVAMAPKVQLLYFDGYGRGEIIRIILNYGGIQFEDKRFSFEEWPKIKPSKLLHRCFEIGCSQSYFSHQDRIRARVEVG